MHANRPAQEVIMPNGNMLDFIRLVAETPSLAGELAALARKHGFEFGTDELTHDDLDTVTGGANVDASAYVQAVMRAAYLEQTQILADYASRITSYNAPKSTGTSTPIQDTGTTGGSLTGS